MVYTFRGSDGIFDYRAAHGRNGFGRLRRAALSAMLCGAEAGAFAVDAYFVEKSFDDTDLGVCRIYPREIPSVGWSPT